LTTTQILDKMELQIMENIALHIVMDDDITGAKWQIKKLAEIGALNKKNTATIKKYAKLLEPAITADITGELTTHLNKVDKMFSPLGTPLPPMATAQVMEVMAATAGNSAMMINTLGNNMLGASQQIYTDSIIQVSNEVLAGISTPTAARVKVISEWTAKGIPALTDKANRNWMPDSYINMQVRTQIRATTTELTLKRSEQYSNDLVEIDSHIGARPGCEPYQGKIYSLSGNHKKYRPLSSTTYGEPDGIFGINCRHNMYPFIEGVSEQTYKPYPKKQTEQAYKESQRQRELERRIKESKRQVAVLKKEGLPTDQAQKTLDNRKSTMNTFINDTGRTRRKSRETI